MALEQGTGTGGRSQSSRGGRPRSRPPTPRRRLPPRPSAPRTPRPSKREKLRRNESLLDIAERYDIPVESITAANPGLNVPAPGVVVNVPLVSLTGDTARRDTPVVSYTGQGNVPTTVPPLPAGGGLNITPTLNRLTAPVRNYVQNLLGQGKVQNFLGQVMSPQQFPGNAPLANPPVLPQGMTQQPVVPGATTVVGDTPVSSTLPVGPPSVPPGGNPVVNTIDELWGGEPWSFYDPESVIAVAEALALKMQEGQFPLMVFPPTQEAWGVSDAELLAAGYEKNEDGIWVRQDVGGLPTTQGYSTGGGGGYRTYGGGGGGGYLYPRAYNSTGYKYAPTGFGLVNWRI